MPETDPANLGELLALIERWCRVNLQRRPREVGLRWGNGRPTTWLPLAEVMAEGGGAVAPAQAETFVPNTFQESILEALEGKALRTDALGAAVGDRGRLYKSGGLKELREQGWVSHHHRLGFYRPDAPPAELREGQGQGP